MRTTVVVVTALALIVLSLPSLASSTIITVRQDGSGDFTTITNAVAAAVDNDFIDVGPGAYVEAVLIEKFIHIFSSQGASATILDGQNTLQMLRYQFGGGGSLDGFTLRNGWFVDGGGAMTVLIGSTTLNISDCIFEDNAAGFQGGAFSAGGPTIDLTFTNCEFRRNTAVMHGGVASIIQGARSTFEGCTFVENSTPVVSGAIQCAGGQMNVFNCLFDRNQSGDVSGAIYYKLASGTVENNTFFQNTSRNRATVVIDDSPAVLLHRNIFAGETDGFAVQYLGFPGSHSCNLYWANADGPISGAVLAPDEIVADPLFCAPILKNFLLNDISPAVATNSPCGLLIGAFPIGCGAVAAEETTWGRVKSIYRDSQ